MVSVESVGVHPSNIKISVGEWCRAVCTELSPDHADDFQIEWSSSNPSIVHVDTVGGVIYGKSEGVATVYATAQDGSGKMGACTVTVAGQESVF